MKKVYIITWFTAEPYESGEGINRVFSTRKKAEKYLKETGLGPHGVDEENYDAGYFLSARIEEYILL